MGQKVNPIGIRLGIVRDWSSTWYAEKRDFLPIFLNQDLQIRDFFAPPPGQRINQPDPHFPSGTIGSGHDHHGRPGIVIGKRGEDIERLRAELGRLVGVPASINVEEIRKPELDAQLVAESVAQQLEKRIMFRRAMKRAVGNAMRLGSQGIKIQVGGRLNGAEIARTEWYREGRVPLHTLRADIDYALAEAHTTYGVIGVKVWIFKGEVFHGDGPVTEHAGEKTKA